MKFERLKGNFEPIIGQNMPTPEFELIIGRSGSGIGSTFYRRFGKRALDLTLVLLAAPLILTVLAPLLAAVAMDRSNPFYSQVRVGQGGRPYRIWKLRSMVPNAEALLQTHLEADPDAREEWDRDQKLKNDPRITRVGRFLRRTSLDELPQFWNVLLGEMSVVGPRPMLESQKELYPGEEYYELRPGITGLWQISARNQSTFADRAHFDTNYSSGLSLRTDLQVLFATVVVVFSGTGH